MTKDANNTCRTEVRDGVTLVFGSMEIMALAKLMKQAPKGSVVDASLARMLGASMAFGSPQDTQMLRVAANTTKISGEREEIILSQLGTSVSEAAARWLVQGERGLSSMAIFSHLTGYPGNKQNHPRDPDDLRRCRKLLEQVPEFRSPRFDLMANVSEIWSGFVTQWDDLCEVMDYEMGTNSGYCPRTFEMMRAIYNPKEALHNL